MLKGHVSVKTTFLIVVLKRWIFSPDPPIHQCNFLSRVRKRFWSAECRYLYYAQVPLYNVRYVFFHVLKLCKCGMEFSNSYDARYIHATKGKNRECTLQLHILHMYCTTVSASSFVSTQESCDTGHFNFNVNSTVRPDWISLRVVPLDRPGKGHQQL